MGDSGLMVYLGIAAWAIVVVALVLTAVAWRTPKRPVRVGIGLCLLVLGLLGGALSLVAFLLVTGLGAAVLILGIAPGSPTHKTSHRPVSATPLCWGVSTVLAVCVRVLALLVEIIGLMPRGSATLPPAFVGVPRPAPADAARSAGTACVLSGLPVHRKHHCRRSGNRYLGVGPGRGSCIGDAGVLVAPRLETAEHGATSGREAVCLAGFWSVDAGGVAAVGTTVPLHWHHRLPSAPYRHVVRVS